MSGLKGTRRKDELTCEGPPFLRLNGNVYTAQLWYLCRLELELERGVILSRLLWERVQKGGASLQKQARVRALCGVMQ